MTPQYAQHVFYVSHQTRLCGLHVEREKRRPQLIDWPIFLNFRSKEREQIRVRSMASSTVVEGAGQTS